MTRNRENRGADQKTQFVISRSVYDAVIFDLDGVVTKTAKVHAAAWKKLFDEYLKQRAAREGEDFQPFDVSTDYPRYVDGKPRYDGVRDFLLSRGIELPHGTPQDAPEKETVCGLGNKKNKLFREYLKTQGAEAYASTVSLIEILRSKGFRTAIVSSSKNCADVLDAADLTELFDAKIDGLDAAELGLEGKPAPDIFVEAARHIGAVPERSIVVEDAIAGVKAGHRGGFGCVIGVDRTDHAEALKRGGADVVVKDLAEIAVGEENPAAPGQAHAPPSALEHIEEIEERLKDKTAAVFLDYDGTLTPIVETPDRAILSQDMRETVRSLSARCPVAVISGRDLNDVRKLVGIDTTFYAGSHGFDIAGPEEHRMKQQQGTDFLPVLDRVEQNLQERLHDIPGTLVERKKFSIAVHYRKVDPSRVDEVERIVDEIVEGHSELRKSSGKKVFDLQPNIDWHKGKAVLWLLETLQLNRTDVMPVYLGDDTTDEDAFTTLEGRGITVVVMRQPRPTAARYRLTDTADVRTFLESLKSIIGERTS
jgi:alpha,alpha-trehalase